MRNLMLNVAQFCMVKAPKRNLKYKPMNLTERELQVLDLISKEYTTERIAQYLHITTSTVETHRRNLFQK
jgi:DNA-binding CsgD family transcriptional regulator